MRPRIRLLAVAVLAVASQAQDNGASRAIRLLLSVADQQMNTAECSKADPRGPPYTIGRDLAGYLAAFTDGENRVKAECDKDECSIQISHKKGEAVFSAVYRFKVAKDEQVDRRSLFCASTP